MLMNKSVDFTKWDFIKIYIISINNITQFYEILTRSKQSRKKLNYMVSAIVTFSNERQAHLMAQMNKVHAAQTTHKNADRLMFTEMENTSNNNNNNNNRQITDITGRVS